MSRVCGLKLLNVNNESETSGVPSGGVRVFIFGELDKGDVEVVISQAS